MNEKINTLLLNTTLSKEELLEQAELLGNEAAEIDRRKVIKTTISYDTRSNPKCPNRLEDRRCIQFDYNDGTSETSCGNWHCT